MLRKIINYVIVSLSLVALFFGDIAIPLLRDFNIDRITFETVLMPLGALGTSSLPFFVIILFFLNLKRRSLLLGIVFLVIGSVVTASGYAAYETWQSLLEENSEDPKFQNNFSKQLPFHKFTVIQGGLILSAGIYFIVRYLWKHKIDQKIT